MRHYCLGGCSAPSVCARRSRPVPGVRAGTWCCVSLVSPSPPRVFRAACGGPFVRVSLTLARWYAIPRSLRVPRARSSCPSGSPRVSLSCVCARALAASAPPSPWVVWRAHLSWSLHWALVGPFHVVRAPPRVLPRSPAPSGVLGGGRSGPGSPLLGFGLWGWRQGVPGGVPSTVARGVWGHALPLPRLPAHWAGCRGPRSTCCGRGRAGVGALLCPLGRHALWGLRAAGRVRGVHVLGGGLGEGGACTVPPGCAAGGGPVGWGLSTGPTACALVGRLCSLWGRRKGVPGGGAFHHCEGRLGSGAVPPPTACPLDGLLGSATHVLWVRVCRCGGPTLSPWPACPVGAACRGGGGGPSPGGVACHRCEGRLVSGAVPPPAARPLERAARVPQSVCPGCGRCGRGDPESALQRAPLRAGVARCGGGGRVSPGGGVFHHCEGRLVPGAVPPPTARPLCELLGSATHVLWVQVCGCGGSTLSPWPACPVKAACRGGGGGPSPGGSACHRCEGRLVSGAVPPPAACPLQRAARVPRPVCRGCGRCGRWDPAPAPQRAPLWAGVARCGAGGRASGGGVPSTIVRGVWGQALSLP